jgi:hypothetical protein
LRAAWRRHGETVEAQLVALERRVGKLEAGIGDQRSDHPSGRATPDQRTLAEITPTSEVRGFVGVPEPAKPRFDRKANHKRYMRECRARQTALRRQQQGVRP